MKIRFRFVYMLVAIALSACASYVEETRAIRNSYAFGEYEEALAKLEKSAVKSEKNSVLLYHLEKASILDRLARYDGSRKELFSADQIAADLYTTSISNTAKTFLLSERSSDYAGEDFEKVAIHILLALSFLEENNLKSALVEARKINTVLKEITKDYDPQNNSYQEDAFARVLAAIIYESMDQLDDAILDYRKACELYNSRSFRNFFDEGQVPEGLILTLLDIAHSKGRSDVLSRIKSDQPSVFSDWEKARKGKNGKEEGLGELIVIHQQGAVATKFAKEFVFVWGQQLIRFSFPYYPEPGRGRNYGFTGLRGTSLPNQLEANNLVNLDRIAYQTLEDRRGRLLAKGAARLIAKGQMNKAANEHFGILGGIAMNAFTAATETADTRSWTLLPKRFYLSRIKLPAGEHHIKAFTDGRLSPLDVKIEKGKKKIVRVFG